MANVNGDTVSLLENKVILVIGTGAGLGKETVRAMLREGARVALADFNLDSANKVRDELDPDGSRTSVHQHDLANYDGAPQLIADVVAAHGQLDGISGVAALDNISGGLFGDTILDDWDRVSKVNIGGYIAAVKAAVPHLEASSDPSITIVGSVAGARPSIEWPQMAYSLSKYAQIGLTHNLSSELGSRGIRVNDVAPGYKWGPVLEAAYQNVADEHGITLEQATQPAKDLLALRRFPTDMDVANALVFFHSYLSSNVTGQTLYVDAGQILN